MEQEPQISWVAHEHVHLKRSADWYWAVGLLSFAIALASFIFDNVLFGALILISAFTLMLHAARGPQLYKYEVTSRGIVAHTSLYPYETIQSFWIHEEYHPKRLVIKSKRTVLPHITIPLGEMEPSEVRQLLRPKLKEERHDPSLSEVISDYLNLYI